MGTYQNLSWGRVWCSKMSVISTVGRPPNSSNMNCLTEAQNPTTKCTLFTTINVFSSVEVDIENNGLHLLICTWTLALGKKKKVYALLELCTRVHVSKSESFGCNRLVQFAYNLRSICMLPQSHFYCREVLHWNDC